LSALIRRIGIATRAREARAVVEDDFHHFRVIVRHDGAAVTGVTSEALRRPWTTCALAGEQLSKLEGFKLAPRASAALDYTSAKFQCTHMFDIAGLAIAAAARGIAARRYEAVIPDRAQRDGQTAPVLSRDGVEVLRWDLRGNVLHAPPVFAGRSLRAGFSEWVDRTLDVDDAEAAFILRRAILVSGGRGLNLDVAVHAPMGGACFVQQPERAPEGLRMVGSTLDFSERREALLSEDGDWLKFA